MATDPKTIPPAVFQKRAGGNKQDKTLDVHVWGMNTTMKMH